MNKNHLFRQTQIIGSRLNGICLAWNQLHQSPASPLRRHQQQGRSLIMDDRAIHGFDNQTGTWTHGRTYPWSWFQTFRNFLVVHHTTTEKSFPVLLNNISKVMFPGSLWRPYPCQEELNSQLLSPSPPTSSSSNLPDKRPHSSSQTIPFNNFSSRLSLNSRTLPPPLSTSPSPQRYIWALGLIGDHCKQYLLDPRAKQWVALLYEEFYGSAHGDWSAFFHFSTDQWGQLRNTMNSRCPGDPRK